MTCKTDKTRQEQEQDWLASYAPPVTKNGSTVQAAPHTSPDAPRTPKKCHSKAAKVLEAANGLNQPFGLSALVLAAWKLYPADFGLPGCEKEYPDARIVNLTLCGSRGLVAKGLLRRLRGGLYEVIR